jgi:formamidopyrimidine-DNA glycosylase
MPELPDVTVYLEALESRILLRRPLELRLGSPFVLRSIDPPVSVVAGTCVRELRRVGKRIAIGMDNGCWLVIHLMIAGRLHWEKPRAKLPGRRGLAALDFDHGSLTLTEAGTKRRASIHLVRGLDGLRGLDPGGLEPLDATLGEFSAALRRENHTLKRALTDPHLLSGIGNAYSDEILHAARLSPVALSQRLDNADVERLYQAVQATLLHWIAKLRAECGDGFPEKVTAFRPEMAVHGRFGEPCPVCRTKVQRIRYAENETNYCPGCQTGGRLLADRSLSRLLKSDWPRTLEEMEARKSQ